MSTINILAANDRTWKKVWSQLIKSHLTQLNKKEKSSVITGSCYSMPLYICTYILVNTHCFFFIIAAPTSSRWVIGIWVYIDFFCEMGWFCSFQVTLYLKVIIPVPCGEGYRRHLRKSFHLKRHLRQCAHLLVLCVFHFVYTVYG